VPAVTETPVAGQLLIGGRWVPAADGDVRESRNPATGETLGSMAEAGQPTSMPLCRPRRRLSPGPAGLG
jgi:hypothetical protein